MLLSPVGHQHFLEHGRLPSAPGSQRGMLPCLRAATGRPSSAPAAPSARTTRARVSAGGDDIVQEPLVGRAHRIGVLLPILLQQLQPALLRVGGSPDVRTVRTLTAASAPMVANSPWANRTPGRYADSVASHGQHAATVVPCAPRY